MILDYGDKEDLILLAAIHTSSGKEQENLDIGFSYSKEINIDSKLENLYKFIDKNEEGYVIRFSNGERCKIKGDEYIRLHKMKSNLSSSTVWEFVSEGKNLSDLLIDFPDELYFKVEIYEKHLRNIFFERKQEILRKYSSIDSNYDKKKFADEIKYDEDKNFLFAIKNNKIDFLDKSIWKEIKPEYCLL